MNNKPDYYAIKVMHIAESIEIAERIEWCKENKIEFFPVSILGCFVAGNHYTAEEMQEIGVLTLGEGAEIDLSTLPPINIGMGFVFYNEVDACAFKLKWA